MRWRPIGVAVLLTATLLPSTAAAQSPLTPKDAAAAKRIRLERAAIGLVNAADDRSYARRPSCRPKFSLATPAPTHDAPSRAVLDALAPLRRPATPADSAGSPTLPFGGEVYVDYVRAVTAADGTTLQIVVGRSVMPSVRRSAACLDLAHHQLRIVTRHVRAATRSRAFAEFARLREAAERARRQPTTPQDGLYLFGARGGGGGGPISDFLTHGVFFSAGAGDGPARVTGLVPDGVASITFEYPRVVGHGPDYAPTVYPHAVERTVRVQENVVAFRAPRPAQDAIGTRMVWRAADGHVLRVVGPR